MPEDNSLFLKRKRRAASGRTRTHDVLHTRQTFYQLSHRGSSAGQAESLNVMQRQSHLFPDKQGNSISVLYSIHVHAYYLHVKWQRPPTLLLLLSLPPALPPSLPSTLPPLSLPSSLPSFLTSTVMVKMQCDREECLFRECSAIVLFVSP